MVSFPPQERMFPWISFLPTMPQSSMISEYTDILIQFAECNLIPGAEENTNIKSHLIPFKATLEFTSPRSIIVQAIQPKPEEGLEFYYFLV